MQAATGAGKTAMACMIAESAVEKGKRVLFLAHRRELVNQAANKLRSIGIRCGIIMAGEMPTDWYGVQVASKDTLLARSLRRKKMELPEADVVFEDECHRALSAGYGDIIKAYPKAIHIGLTATPCRGDGRGLGELYEGIVEACPMAKLIADGFLVPVRVFAPYVPDMKGVQTGADGDWVGKQVSERMDRSAITGDILAHWCELANDRPTMVFAAGVNHSIHLRDQFAREGYRAAHLDAKTPKDDRDFIIQQYARGDIQVLCSCDVLTEGVDLPLCSCIVMARPTKSMVVFRQQIGRGMRPAEGKSDCLLLDHAGNTLRHGFPDEEIEWTLSTEKRANNRENQKKPPRQPIICKKCFCAFYQQSTCPNCGHKAERGRNKVQTRDGNLVELKRGEKKEVTHEDRQRYWWYCLRTCAYRGLNAKVAAGMFNSHFKLSPWEALVGPLPDRSEWGKPVVELFPNLIRRQGT